METSEYIKFSVITPKRHNNTIHFTPHIKTTPFNPKTAAPASIFHIRPAAPVIIPLQCLWTEPYLQLSPHSRGDLSWARSPWERKVIKRRALPSTKTASTISILFTTGGVNGSRGRLGTAGEKLSWSETHWACGLDIKLMTRGVTSQNPGVMLHTDLLRAACFCIMKYVSGAKKCFHDRGTGCHKHRSGLIECRIFRRWSPEGSRGSVWGGAARLCQVFRGELIDSEFIKISLTCLNWMCHDTKVSVSGEIWFKAPVDAALPSSGCPTLKNTQHAYIKALKWSLILIMSIDQRNMYIIPMESLDSCDLIHSNHFKLQQQQHVQLKSIQRHKQTVAYKVLGTYQLGLGLPLVHKIQQSSLVTKVQSIHSNKILNPKNSYTVLSINEIGTNCYPTWWPCVKIFYYFVLKLQLSFDFLLPCEYQNGDRPSGLQLTPHLTQ